jgi:hypothetical protein
MEQIIEILSAVFEWLKSFGAAIWLPVSFMIVGAVVQREIDKKRSRDDAWEDGFGEEEGYLRIGYLTALNDIKDLMRYAIAILGAIFALMFVIVLIMLGYY